MLSVSSLPVSMAMPLSRAKIAFRPPPRSSLPRMPQREVFLPPEVSLTAEPSGPAWLTYSMPASTRPYMVTLDWADADPAAARPIAANAIALRFMLSPCLCLLCESLAGRMVGDAHFQFAFGMQAFRGHGAAAGLGVSLASKPAHFPVSVWPRPFRPDFRIAA
ncbi:hypothetical protein D3C72_1580110 [compost metagenome]